MVFPLFFFLFLSCQSCGQQSGNVSPICIYNLTTMELEAESETIKSGESLELNFPTRMGALNFLLLRAYDENGKCAGIILIEVQPFNYLQSFWITDSSFLEIGRLKTI